MQSYQFSTILLAMLFNLETLTMKKIYLLIVMITMPTLSSFTYSYPLDGYNHTLIRRLLRIQRIEDGKVKDKGLLPGQKLGIDEIKLRLLGDRGSLLDSLPIPDPGFQKALNALFPVLHESYSIAVMDISPDRDIRYATRNETRGFQPGSVGKLAILAGIFTELEHIYPDSYQDRVNLLCNKVVRAGNWALPNIHTVPVYDPVKETYQKRLLVDSDMFNLFEWVDHMISVSSNGAASVVWREVVLMRAFGKDYPKLNEEEASAFFKKTPKSELRSIAMSVVNDPLRKLGITEKEWRLGSFFTSGAKAMIPGEGGSTGTPSGMMKYLVAMERGKIVDESSSLEMKRLLYLTDRRIRYASANILNEAAVFFKSGSLYKCKPEAGFSCGKYMGNVENYMNSIAIVEHGDSTIYLVALMSNVLKRNSGSDHRALAEKIDKLIRN